MARKSQSREPVEIDGITGKATPFPSRRMDLSSIDGCRRELARVYKDMRTGRIDCADGTKLAFVLSALVKMHEAGDLERRLTRLEGKTADDLTDDELAEIVRRGDK
jgi:hypothetical protein